MEHILHHQYYKALLFRYLTDIVITGTKFILYVGFNEASSILFSSLFLLLYGGLILPLAAFAGLSPSSQIIFGSFGILFGNALFVWGICIPKIICIIQNKHNDKILVSFRPKEAPIDPIVAKINIARDEIMKIKEDINYLQGMPDNHIIPLIFIPYYMARNKTVLHIYNMFKKVSINLSIIFHSVVKYFIIIKVLNV